jgi:hypothetical protein
MPRYIIQTRQAFHVTYEVDAPSPEEAWSDLLEGLGNCVDQVPGSFIDLMSESSIEKDES